MVYILVTSPDMNSDYQPANRYAEYTLSMGFQPKKITLGIRLLAMVPCLAEVLINIWNLVRGICGLNLVTNLEQVILTQPEPGSF